MELCSKSDKLQQEAWKIIEDTNILTLWKALKAEVNVVGSLRTGLLFHRDIDLHIYTVELSVIESFSVLEKLAQQRGWKEIQYRNLINTEEECIEWHAWYEDLKKEIWKFDMIHIRKGSRYEGIVERMTEAISHKLTPEIRRTILQIKSEMPDNNKIPGIEVYRGVFTGNVGSYEELLPWIKKHPLKNSLDWLP